MEEKEQEVEAVAQEIPEQQAPVQIELLVQGTELDEDGRMTADVQVVAVNIMTEQTFGENARWKGRTASAFVKTEPQGVFMRCKLAVGATLTQFVQALTDQVIFGAELAVIEAEERDPRFIQPAGPEQAQAVKREVLAQNEDAW